MGASCEARVWNLCTVTLSKSHIVSPPAENYFYKICYWGDSKCQRVGLKDNWAQVNSPCSSFLQDSRGLKPVQEDTPQLMRTRSDVGVRRRGNVRTSSDQRRIRRHRFSINGHFYNHKVEGSWRTNLGDITTSWGLQLQCHVVPGDASGKAGIFSSV